MRFFLYVLRSISLLAGSLLLELPLSHAEPPPPAVQADHFHTLTFSNLIVRVTEQGWIGSSDEHLRIKLLEHLRKRGYPALGAESLVFNKDDSDKARFVLGGTLTRAECDADSAVSNDRLCRIEIAWELFSRSEDRVVYSMVARSSAAHLILTTMDGKERAARQLIMLALDSLLKRPKFQVALSKSASHDATTSHYTPAAFRQCAYETRPMPASAGTVLGATVLVETAAGFGSGTIISPDGLVLTAAHVVPEAGVNVRLMSGETFPAAVVRVHKAEDVALLYVAVPRDVECIPLRAGAPSVGEEVYAIGSPASKDLAFTLTRGIVSGTREIEGVRYLQTDASINPGNSGGPLIDSQGQVVGVVSWKVVGHSMEGIAFGVPVDAALNALAISSGGATEPSLRTKAVAMTSTEVLEDKPDPMPSLDRTEERRLEAERARTAKLVEKGPPYVRALKIGGAVLAVAGAIGATVSYMGFDEKENTQAEYEDARLRNDISWGLIGTGVGCTITGLILNLTGRPIKERKQRVAFTSGIGVASGYLKLIY